MRSLQQSERFALQSITERTDGRIDGIRMFFFRDVAPAK
ncbi:hypothetical protein AI22_17735 [Pseudomonas aeruginosa YL84]|nr:hypothetical protein AI22_17735 [Pseudomonas aeruginosa YL84]